MTYQNQENSWYGTSSRTVDFSLSTPFEALRSLSTHVEGIEKSDSKTAKLTFEHNGYPLVDVDGQYQSQDKHSAIVTFKHPRAMVFTLDGSENQIDIYANWDKYVINSKVF